jgi:hypothetical protein
MREASTYRRRALAVAAGLVALAASAHPAHAGTAQEVRAVDDEYSVEQGQTVDVNLLENDTEGSYDRIVVVDLGPALHGSFSGPVSLPVYTPLAGFVGDEVIEYTICGSSDNIVSEDCDPATITIHVTGPRATTTIVPSTVATVPPTVAPVAVDPDLASTGGGNGPLLAGLTALGLGALAIMLARRGPISPRRC